MNKNIVFSHFSLHHGMSISARWWRAKKTTPILYPKNYSAWGIAWQPGDGSYMFAFEEDLNG
jgi:hypothetical protein